MKLYCFHKWGIDFVCDSGKTAICKLCHSVWTGRNDQFPNELSNPTVVAFTKTELIKIDEDTMREVAA